MLVSLALVWYFMEGGYCPPPPPNITQIREGFLIRDLSNLSFYVFIWPLLSAWHDLYDLVCLNDLVYLNGLHDSSWHIWLRWSLSLSLFLYESNFTQIIFNLLVASWQQEKKSDNFLKWKKINYFSWKLAEIVIILAWIFFSSFKIRNLNFYTLQIGFWKTNILNI